MGSLGCWRFLWIFAIALTLLACGQGGEQHDQRVLAAQHALNESPDLPHFAVYARNSVVLREHASVLQGDVGIAEVSPGPHLYPHHAAAVLAHAKIDSQNDLLAPSVYLHRHAKVGDVQTTHLSASGATYGSVAPFLSMPLFPVASPVSPGGASLVAPKNKTTTASPGDYGNVTLEQKSVLRLESGVYQLGSLELKPHARLEVLGPVELRIADRLETAAHTYIGFAKGAGLRARDIRIEVHAVDSHGKASAQFGSHSEVRAILLVPNGTVRFGTHNTAVGAFFGYDVDVAQHAKVTFEGGFPCAATSCDDGNPCTADSCVAGRCVHTPLAEGSFCSDGNACNGEEVCDGEGVCQPGTPLEIDDGNPCTVDSCDPILGVIHEPAEDGTSCNDDNACTLGDSCQAGQCVSGSPVSCEPLGPCYLATSCDPATGMCPQVPAPEGTPCGGDACHQAGACDGSGVCVGINPTYEDDGNPCTEAVCDPVTGVVTHVPLPAGTPCSDGNVCNGLETCDSQGQCLPGEPLALEDDGDPCTIDVCDPVHGWKRHHCGEIDRTVSTRLIDMVSFLYSGDDPVQQGVAPGTIEVHRVGHLHGKVHTRDGRPIPGVKISIADHPEFGWTYTQSDGGFDLVVNGGGILTIRYESSDYLRVERTLRVPWNESVKAPDVVMIRLDPVVTEVAFDASVWQTARGSVSNDIDGTRQATILFPPNTEAWVELPDGSAVPLESARIRATEYTIGENGPEAMPAELPPNIAYTYALELTAEEAEALGGRIHFAQPVPFYVENFIGFPVGTPVPTGWYDFDRHAWIPIDSGRVIAVTGIINGRAELDVDGDGIPDTGAALDELGITDAEREELGRLYEPGQSVWRVLLDHFSPWDCNWGFVPPDDAISPEEGGADGGEAELLAENGCEPESVASTVQCQNQVLGQELAIAGTPYTLHYKSDRVSGRRSAFKIKNIRLTGNRDLPVSLEKIFCEIDIAGKKMPCVEGQYSFTPRKNLTIPEFEWDGSGEYGKVQGAHKATISIGYQYGVVYRTTSRFGYNGATSVVITGTRNAATLTLWSRWERTLGVLDTKEQGLGGFSVDVHHSYSPSAQILVHGDGTRRSTVNLEPVVTRFAGTPGQIATTGDGGPARAAKLGAIRRMVTAPDGSVFIAASSVIRKVRPDGTIVTVAGRLPGSRTFAGDGGPATEALLNVPEGLALAPNGDLFIADTGNHRVRRVDKNGIITTVAGTGEPGFAGDHGPALAARLNEPNALAIAADGTIYISERRNCRIRKIAPDGNIVTIAGGVCPSWGAAIGDGGPAIGASMRPYAVAIAPDGSILVVDQNFQTGSNVHAVRRIGLDGRITRIAGGGSDDWGNNVDALDSVFIQPRDLAVDRMGTIIVNDPYRYRVRLIPPDGLIRTLLGRSGPSPRDNTPQSDAAIYQLTNALAIGPDGAWYYDDSYAVYRVATPWPTVGVELTTIPSADSAELYVFDARGRHLVTKDALTGIDLYEFSYDAHGRLDAIRDRDGNETTFQREGGKLVGIVGPYGQRTDIEINADGYISKITNPAGETYSISYSSGGLMQSFEDPLGHTSYYDFDDEGRLRRATNALGAQTRYQRNNAYSSPWTVTKTSPEMVSTEYTVDRTVFGEVFINEYADGTRSTWTADGDGSRTATSRLGTVTNIVSEPDARFGQLAPMPVRRYIELEKADATKLQYEETRTRSFTGLSASSPFVFTELTESTVVNSITVDTTRYRPSTRTFTSADAHGRQSTVTLDAKSRPVRAQVGGLAPTEMIYDPRGRLLAVQQGTRTQTFAYDEDVPGYLSLTRNALGEITRYRRDAVGRIVQTVLPDQEVVDFAYDRVGRITSITPPGKPPHGFVYDQIGQLVEYNAPPVLGGGTNRTSYSYDRDRNVVEVVRPDDIEITYERDELRRLTRLASSTESIDFSYAQGRLVAASGPTPGQALWLDYDAELPVRYTWEGYVNGAVQREYGNFFRIASETVVAGTSEPRRIRYEYDRSGLLTKSGSLSLRRDTQHGLVRETELGNVVDSYIYNDFGEVVGYSAWLGSDHYTYQLTRDDLGRIVRKVESFGGIARTYEYGYDARGRLTDVSIDGVFAEGYEYDANGNRTALLRPGQRIEAEYDAQDRLIRFGDTQYAYTANGELWLKIEPGGITRYEYDVFGNLVGVNLPNGKRIDYIVDAAGRRIGKKVDGTLTRQWLYRDSLKPIAELDANGYVVALFGYGERYTTPSFVERDGKRYRVISDHLGSPRVVVRDSDSNERPVVAEYSVFGEVTGAGLDWMPFGFAGGIYDADTGLVRFGARDYDPMVGRWTSKDPSGFWGGVNVYQYAYSDPINFLDIDGRAPVLAPLLWGAVTGAMWEIAWQLLEGKSFGELDWSNVAIAASIGSITGGVGGMVIKGLEASKRMKFGLKLLFEVEGGLAGHAIQEAVNSWQGERPRVDAATSSLAVGKGAIQCVATPTPKFLK